MTHPTASPTAWEPARTWVFAASVLQFQDPETYPGFAPEIRRDHTFVEALIARGVPASNVAFLTDAQCTRDALQSSLEALLARTREGDTLWFFYAGHGAVDEAGASYFIPHDAGDVLADSAWSVERVVATIARNFRGSRAVLTADCCYSGSLVAQAAQLNDRCQWSAFGSSLASELSTDHWTFTDCLISALQGAASIDLDGDGKVSITDLSRYTDTEMAFAEGQLASFGRSHDMPADLELSRAVTGHDARADARFEAHWHSKWYPARVLEQTPQGARIHYVGEGDQWDEVVPPSRLRPWNPSVMAPGTPVRVKWHRRWYPALVREGRLGIHHIHYENYADSYDEWVAPTRIRPR